MKFIIVDTTDMITSKIGGSSHSYSAIRIDKLEALEYTIVTIVRDKSGSVDNYAVDLVNMCNEVIDACRKSPRAQNLLIRLIDFSKKVDEVHGFVPLDAIKPYDITDFKTESVTSLYDAFYSAIGGSIAYAKMLTSQDFSVNGVVYIITDGADNASTLGPQTIKDELSKIKANENLESLTTVLIGINTKDCGAILQLVKDECNLTQYIDVGEATPQKLAKLAGFISKSISSTSQSLSSAQPAPVQNLTF